MKLEKSCGAVVYRECGSGMEFLAVQSRTFGHWGFPKGHVEEGERELDTARREVLEETGLVIAVCSEFRKSIRYLLKDGTLKEVVYFTGKTLDEDVTVQQEEIQNYIWLDYDKILEILTFDTDKSILTAAKDFLEG